MKLNRNNLVQRLEALSLRERLLSAGTVLCIIFYGFYLLIYAPIANEEILFDQKIAAQKLAYQHLKQLSKEVAELQKYQIKVVKSQEGQSLMNIIDSSSIQLQIKPTIKRVVPDDASKVTLWLENTSFDQFIDWLIALESKHGITVSQLKLTSDQQEIGRVSIRVQLSNEL
jgi:general secretion pathway protein M